MFCLKPFEKNERICFIGDSITVRSYWISCIADHYARNYPQKDIRIFPCGVGGGGAISAMLYFRQQTLIHDPDTAVIMLGMNDIDQEAYFGERTAERLERAERALKRYESNLIALSGLITSTSHIKRLIYLSPTPYDEEQVCETYNRKGCFNALRTCAKIVEKVARIFHGEFYDLGGDMAALLSESHRMESPNELIETDRVHPKQFGMAVMARLFLSAQGFEYPVDAKMICDGSADLMLSEKAQAFQKAAWEMQTYWTIEWCLARKSGNQSFDGKIDYANHYVETNPDADPYFKEIAGQYEYYARNIEKLTQDFNQSAERLYKE